jgi:hypothetical protein
MSMSVSVSDPPVAESEQTAELGWVFTSGPDGGRQLSQARAWHEDGVYTLRSTEFDVIAEDEDFDRAIDAFVAWLIDHATLLADLVDAGKATDEEARTFVVLSARLFPLLRTAEQEHRRHIRRRRAPGAGHWRHQETQASGSARLSAA